MTLTDKTLKKKKKKANKVMYTVASCIRYSSQCLGFTKHQHPNKHAFKKNKCEFKWLNNV